MSATVGGLAPGGRLMVLGATGSLETSPLLLLTGRLSVEGWYLKSVPKLLCRLFATFFVAETLGSPSPLGG